MLSSAAAAGAAAHANTTTPIAEEVARAWNSRVGSIRQPAPSHAIQSIFNDIHLYPTKTQVFEMLVCARQCSRRRSLVLSFGEFCVLAQELRRRLSKKHSVQKRDHSNKILGGESKWDVPATPRTPNGSTTVHPPASTQYELFLGGSCNPTTWRSEIAIPYLDSAGITYFNPQVADWSLELVEVEWRAKQAAKALLFVLDCQTRAVAAAVEAAYLAATGRDLLLVLRPYEAGQTICGEKVSDDEYSELSKARDALQEVVERRGLPVFADVESALRCARVVLRGAGGKRKVAGGAILRLRKAYDAAFKASPARSPLATREAVVRVLAYLSGCSKMLVEKALSNEEYVDFETFCTAAASINDSEFFDPSQVENIENVTQECISEAGPRSAASRRFINRLHARAAEKKLRLMIPKSDMLSKADSPVLSPASELRLQALPASLAEDQPSYSRDVFLADTRHDAGLTRLLQAAHLSVRTAQPKTSHDNTSFTSPKYLKSPQFVTSQTPFLQASQSGDAATVTAKIVTPPPTSSHHNLDRLDSPGYSEGAVEEAITLSRVLVFPITSDAPCLTTMVLAAHYMALRPRHTVLLVQQFTNNTLSECAVKDYNRGRHYLADIASRDNVTVVKEAADVISAVKEKLANKKLANT